MRRLVTLCLLFVFPLQNVLLADKPSELSQLIEEETIFVAQIDFAKIEFPDIILDGVQTEWRKDIEMKVGQLKEIISKANLKTAYLIGNIRLPAVVYFAFPKSDGVDLDVIQGALNSFSGEKTRFEVRETGDFKLLIPVIFALNNVHSDRIVAASIPKKPVDRPEFTEAWNAVADYPVKVLIAIPDFIKRILRETKPIIFDDDKRVDFSVLLDQFRWQAIGLNPQKIKLHAVTETQAENKTQDFLTEVNDFLDAGIGQIGKFLDSDNIMAEKFKEDYLSNKFIERLVEKRKIIRDKIAPKIRGKSLVVSYSLDDLSKLFKELSVNTIFDALYESYVQDVSKNNMKQILLAFHNYHDSHNNLPPAFTVDANGQRLHSWRVLILPYIEQYELYKSIKLDEPWDSEHNKQFHDKMPQIYNTPIKRTDLKDKNRKNTSYCVVVGKDTAFKEDGKKIDFGNFNDGTSNTILVVERKTPVSWMQPEDITQEDAFKGVNKGGEKGIRADANGVMRAGFGDGSARNFLEGKITEKTLRAYLTISGGETITP
ncbi:MAG: DUF1559 domain-containing protein [Planctomycetaceae bacterium]|jgi:hypothetical protein|nr:DUF1559 domain-containing protein [Planctomycetaceae bacterium]